jgi:hypothetical protein
VEPLGCDEGVPPDDGVPLEGGFMPAPNGASEELACTPEVPVRRAWVSASAYCFAAGEPSSIVTPGSGAALAWTEDAAAIAGAHASAIPVIAPSARTLTHTLLIV